jgi:cardiolipin synthase
MLRLPFRLALAALRFPVVLNAIKNQISVNSQLFICENLNQNSLKINRFSTSNLFKSSNDHNLKGDATKLKTENVASNDQDRILTVPNILTLSRILSVPVINYFVFVNKHEYACLLFTLSGITDVLDGYIARNFKNQSSNLGSILDPLADKLLIGSLTITLFLNSMIPSELAFIILVRDLGLILSSLYIRYKLIEKPVTLEKYLSVRKHASIQVKPDSISKFNTFLQILLITFTLPSILLDYQSTLPLVTLQYLTGFTTILSTISYLYKRGSYKVQK